MKRIFKSVMGAVCCSIILALIFPSAFLEGDAKWISQSDMGRMDISFEGDIKNGEIEVKGNHLKIDKPKWFLKENYQGVMVQFPVSYFKKSYQVSIVPQGDKTGEDFSLIFTFRGQDLRENNQVKPAWVKFSHIKVNGKLIGDNQTVWHNKSFRYSLKNLSKFNPIKIEFEIQKPIVFSDVSWKNLIVFLGLFILLFCFPFSQKIGKIISSKMIKILSLINNTDVMKAISDGYFKIDQVYRRSFWIIFGVLCITFGFHTVQYMWGNHDWGFLVYPKRWNGEIWMGRYTLNLFKEFFLNGIYLPVVYDIITFFTLALNAVLLCIYLRLEKRLIYFVLCGLILTVQPFTLSLIYYVHMLPETFIGVTFALTALLLSEKIAFEKNSFIKKGFLALVCIVLINLSLAMYPVIINTIAVAFAGRLLIQSLDWNGSWKNFKSCFFPFSISAANIIFGIGLYKIIITFVFPMISFYNTETLSLEKLPERLLVLLKQSFYQLYDYSFPFISQPVLWVFLGLTILVALYICFKGNIKQKIIRLLLLFGALFATQTAMIIAKQHLISGRVELFGLVVFEVLITILVLMNLKIIRNWVLFAMIGVSFISIINDLDCLRVWKLGFDAEKMLWVRVLARLEMQEDFNINRKYKVVQIGAPVSLRSRFYTKASQKFHENGLDVLNYSYDPFWSSFVAQEFYYPISFKDRNFHPDKRKPDYQAELRRLYKAGILDKAKAWPHKNGLIVWNDVILYVTDEKALTDCKKELEKEFPKPKANSEENSLETNKELSQKSE